MNAYDIAQPIEKYGEKATLRDIHHKLTFGKYRCPKCNGTGSITEFIPGVCGYTPDEYKHIKCNLCYGKGYTHHEYKPKMVQAGWE